MTRLLSADVIRMIRSKWFWLCQGGMLLMAAAFIVMQYTAMEYTVPLSRVIFLPLSFYGIAVAALVSLFVGTDFSDGFIRNKLIAGRSRGAVYLSNLVVSGLACVMIYLVTTLFTSGVGVWFFERNVTGTQFQQYLGLGILTCMAYSSIFTAMTMLCGDKAASTVLCMGLSFLMLFLCLHTNQILVQPQYKDGMLNPHYVDGVRRVLYGALHDLNPSGQLAQLSAMEIYEPVRWIVCDLVWVLLSMVGGISLFRRADIR